METAKYFIYEIFYHLTLPSKLKKLFLRIDKPSDKYDKEKIKPFFNILKDHKNLIEIGCFFERDFKEDHYKKGSK